MNYRKLFIIGIILIVFINVCAISANENITETDFEVDDTLKNDAPIEAEIIPVNLENEYQNGNFSFKLVDKNTNEGIKNQKIQLNIGTNVKTTHVATTGEDGIAYFKTNELFEVTSSNKTYIISNLSVGVHPIDLYAQGNITAPSIKTNLVIEKATLNIAIDPFKEYYGTDKNITITATYAKDASKVPDIVLHLLMPQLDITDYYVKTDKNGQCSIGVKSLASGNYSLSVNTNDTKNINYAIAEQIIIIDAKPCIIKAANSATTYYNTGNLASITVKDNITGNAVPNVIVSITIDSKKTYIYQTDSKGQININDLSLSPGTHKRTISLADSNYYAHNLTQYVSIKKANGKFTQSKITSNKNKKSFTIKLTNTKNSKPIHNAKVNVKIYISPSQYHNYNGLTDANGKIKIAINTNKKIYKIIISGTESQRYHANPLKTQYIKSTITKVSAPAVTATYKQSKAFKITVKSATKPVKNLKISVKVGSKSYTLTTNAKGVASLNTAKLSVGKYNIVIGSKNSKYFVDAKSSITIKKAATKYIANKNSHIFHHKSCSAVKKMSSKNKVSLTRTKAISLGYKPCGICNP